MTLKFPNASRSYDSERNRVRFSGYDGMFQIDFAVEIDAIAGNRNPETERSSLDAFDAALDAIRDAARRSYKRNQRSLVVLTREDFRG